VRALLLQQEVLHWASMIVLGRLFGSTFLTKCQGHVDFTEQLCVLRFRWSEMFSRVMSIKESSTLLSPLKIIPSCPGKMAIDSFSTSVTNCGKWMGSRQIIGLVFAEDMKTNTKIT
jgi:hypothetical protein